MNSSLSLVIRSTLLAGAALCLSACASMLANERSACVLIRPASPAPAYEVPGGPTEATVDRLVSRQNYRYTRDIRAAWLIYVDERPGENPKDASRYVIGEVLRNPQSRYPDESPASPRDLAAQHRQHSSLEMLGRYEQAEQSRGHSSP